MPRDELAEALWGEAPPPTWDKALTVIVSKVRSLLPDRDDGANALTSAFGCYRLDLPEGTWVDVIVAVAAAKEAEEALTTGDLEKAKTAAALAASLLRQPFLPGEEGTWVAEKRREFADVRSRGLSVLADACLRSGDAPAAAKWAEQTIALAPFRETGYRRLMEAHVAAGNRAEALQVYEQCRQLLAEELGTYPSPETESVYRGLLEAPSDHAVAADTHEARQPNGASLGDREREPASAVERRAPDTSRSAAARSRARVRSGRDARSPAPQPSRCSRGEARARRRPRSPPTRSARLTPATGSRSPRRPCEPARARSPPARERSGWPTSTTTRSPRSIRRRTRRWTRSRSGTRRPG